MDGLEPTWRKSIRSGSTGNCVEVGDADHAVLIRDTTNRDGGTLTFTTTAWTAFLGTAR